MTTRERIAAVKLIESAKKQRAYAEKLGININQNKNTKEGNIYEKN